MGGLELALTLIFDNLHTQDISHMIFSQSRLLTPKIIDLTRVLLFQKDLILD
jgi:hypothetical protein